eukprot:TRINITY_DN7010_c0_g1_i1.p4 TRINITY_DN7010_c0_g1~~TRINITY_DN7010_c0_g1_i1.p4  ORF type:complete len:114 (-),score=5.16 TRINITY_DN7010_c0_g1_i1:179-520(-)
MKSQHRVIHSASCCLNLSFVAANEHVTHRAETTSKPCGRVQTSHSFHLFACNLCCDVTADEVLLLLAAAAVTAAADVNTAPRTAAAMSPTLRCSLLSFEVNSSKFNIADDTHT